MALTIEQAQELSNMRARILANTQAGRQPHDGFTKEELTKGLSFIRQGKTLSAEAGAAKKAKAANGTSKKVKAPAGPVKSADDFLKGIDLDS